MSLQRFLRGSFRVSTLITDAIAMLVHSGRAGSKITEIRRLSGSKISIAKTPHDDSGERMFTIVGPPEANEKALFLLYNQLESESTSSRLKAVSIEIAVY